MGVMNYLAKQKRRVYERHEGEECVIFKGEYSPVRPTSGELLVELEELVKNRAYKPESASEYFAWFN